MSKHINSLDSLNDMKAEDVQIENEKGLPVVDLKELAERGHAVTDEDGNVLLQFDPVAEKKLLRKIDLYVVPTVMMLYLWCFIDRANIGNAKIAGLEKDLGMKGYDYNVLLTVFYVPYIFFEIPSNIACKYVGPKLWIPFLCFGFGVSLEGKVAGVKSGAEWRGGDVAAGGGFPLFRATDSSAHVPCYGIREELPRRCGCSLPARRV